MLLTCTNNLYVVNYLTIISESSLQTVAIILTTMKNPIQPLGGASILNRYWLLP